MIAIEALTAALSYVALALLLGQLVVAGFVLPKGEPHELRRSSLTFARSSLVIFLCSSTLALLIQGAKLQRGFPSAELLWRYVAMTQSGKVWLARELYAIPEGSEAWTGLAIGYRGEPSALLEALRPRDLAERQRRPLADFVFGGRWGVAAGLVLGR